MENPQEAAGHEKCGCAGGGCSCRRSCSSCIAKVAIGLWLLLVGGIIGFFMGHCCASHSYHRMMSCPITMETPVTTPQK